MPVTNWLLQDCEVLVVEDYVDASEILPIVLADAGARVRVAQAYVTALRLSEQKWPDVLVSDISLPAPDGYDLIRQLRHLDQSASKPRFFAVALTAISRPRTEQKPRRPASTRLCPSRSNRTRGLT